MRAIAGRRCCSRGSPSVAARSGWCSRASSRQRRLMSSGGASWRHVEDVIRVAAEGRCGHARRGYHAPSRRPHWRIVPVRLPFQPPLEPMLAKPARRLPEGDGWLFEPKWDGFRAHRVPRRRRGLHPEPRPQAARPLLPRARRAAARTAAGALRPRRRGRHRRTGRPGLRVAAAAHPSRRVARRDARRAVAGLVRRLGPARARRPRPPGRAARHGGASCSSSARRRRARPST